MLGTNFGEKSEFGVMCSEKKGKSEYGVEKRDERSSEQSESLLIRLLIFSGRIVPQMESNRFNGDFLN
jgi:hypothetical protein